MQLAKCCGLNIAEVKKVYYGNHPALLVERFDRKLLPSNQVKRRHMIDGCQALNLSPDDKYERNFGSGKDVAHIREGASLVKLFDFSNQCMNPIITKQQIINWVLFNILIFNCDAHAKNISFFINDRGIELAPFYDLVNIKMYPEFEQDMAMGLGDEFDSNTINAYQLADFADSCRLSRQLISRNLRSLIKKLIIGLETKLINLANNEQEQQYIEQYKNMVYIRCRHLEKETDGIVSINL